MKLQPHEDVSVQNTLHHAVGPFLVLSRLFGILPLNGVWSSAKVTEVYFEWCSPVTLVTFFFLSYTFFDLFLSAKVVVERGLKLYTAGPFTFSVICLAAYSVFLQLSRHWPQLIRCTRQVEAIFLQKSYQNPQSMNMSRRIRRFGVLILIGAIVEHMTYKSSALYSNHLHIQNCNLTVSFVENYFLRERLQIFSIIKFRLWLVPFVEKIKLIKFLILLLSCIPLILFANAIPMILVIWVRFGVVPRGMQPGMQIMLGTLKWITIGMTFAWNFVDIFLTFVCLALATRFNQLLWKVKRHVKEQMPSEFWATLRNDLMTLTDLLHEMDDKLSGLVLLSCSHNLYFICVQVFNGFIPQPNFMREIYFWFSLIFVLTRFLIMMFAASSIHEAANNILSAVYEIPTSHWSLELKRFNEIIASEIFALSGRKFFFVTRRLIFAMFGKIVTYELVLIGQVKDVSDNSTNQCMLRKID